MSGPDDIVREALASLLATHSRATVTDPRAVRSLLEPALGPHALDPALIDALVLATHTPVLRHLSDDDRADTTEAQLATELRKLGVGGSTAATAATAWSAALLPGTPRPVTRAFPAPVVAAMAPDQPPRPPQFAPPAPLDAAPPPPARPVPPPITPTPPRPTAAMPPPAAAPPPSPPTPAPTAAPSGPDPRPQRPRPAWLEAPVLGSDTGDAPAVDHAPATAPFEVAGVIGAPIEHHEHDGWPRTAKVAVGVLAVLAVAIAAFAFVGWTRDPSKDRASSAESTAAGLTNELATAKQATVDANAATAAAKTTIGERDAQLATAKDQITKMATISRSQLNSARFPDQFAMSGKVAPGSCSLTGDACNVTAALRNVKLTCATKPCDCTSGSCTVTSELWKTAAPVTFDASTNLFTAKGLLDGDVFRCAGVAQPTTFEFRFRVAKITYDESVWKVAGLDAELAEASSAVAECLAGNRTYALTGPVA